MMSGPHDHSMVVIDTETTGLIPPPVDVVVEIGAVVFHHGEYKSSYTSLIRPPDNYMNPRRLEVCARVSNITMAMLREERTVDIVGDEFADWLAPFVKDGFQIQSFNKAFDRPMMDGVGVNMTTRLMMRHKVKPEWGECIMNAATDEIRRMGLNSTRSQMFTGSGRQVSYRTSLADAMAILKIQPTAGKTHRADTDALHAAYVYQEILKRRQSRRIKFMNEGLE